MSATAITDVPAALHAFADRLQSTECAIPARFVGVLSLLIHDLNQVAPAAPAVHVTHNQMGPINVGAPALPPPALTLPDLAERDRAAIQSERLAALAQENQQLKARLAEMLAPGEPAPDAELRALHATNAQLTQELQLLRDKLAAAQPVFPPTSEEQPAPVPHGEAAKKVVLEAGPYRDERHDIPADINKLFRYYHHGQQVPLTTLTSVGVLAVVRGALNVMSCTLERLVVPPQSRAFIVNAQEALEKVAGHLGRSAEQLEVLELKGGLLRPSDMPKAFAGASLSKKLSAEEDAVLDADEKAELADAEGTVDSADALAPRKGTAPAKRRGNRDTLRIWADELPGKQLTLAEAVKLTGCMESSVRQVLSPQGQRRGGVCGKYHLHRVAGT